MSPPSRQVPVEDVDGTVKYPPGSPGRPQAPFGPPPGVPVSPFDTPPHYPGGMPPSGPPPGMPPVSSVPASGVPVSPGQGQFGPQGGQLVPVSGTPGGQPWGGGRPGQIQRKKKSNKAPMWILLGGVVVIAAALAAGGFILFSPMSDEPSDVETGTIETPAAPEPAAVGDAAAGLNFVIADGAAWSESAEAPSAFSSAAGVSLEDGGASAFVGEIDTAAVGGDDDSVLGDVAAGFDAALAEHLGGEAGDAEAQSYWIDARPAQFRTFTVGDTTVVAAIIELDTGSFAGFAAFGTGDHVETLEAFRGTLQFGEPQL
ncbi:hypothetical protein GCM10027447_08940 [Glycomyces halotolerans]